MGCVFTRPETDFMVEVQTGDRRHAGTDAAVRIVLYDAQGHASTPINLDNFFKDDFERGSLDSFRIPFRKVRNLNKHGQIVRIEFWKEDSWLGGDWYVDVITVKNHVTQTSFVFPVCRWVKTDFHYHVKLYDTCLPQMDEFPDQRAMDLQERRAEYQYGIRFCDGPVKVKQMPTAEQYSFDYKWDFPDLRAKLTSASLLASKLSSGRWQSLNAMKNLYNESTFSRPKCVIDWANDVQFGLQRALGFNHSVITTVDAFPDKLPVTDQMLDTLLEELTLQQAIEQKRLFVCDLEMLEDCPVKEDFVLCNPIALFFVDSRGVLLPVAIQLFQEPGPDNPVFTPKDPAMLWTLVKMWYNNADAAHHYAVTRFAHTQCLMEGFAISAVRHLPRCHPVYRLLAPHLLYLIPINGKTLNFLTTKDEWLDRNLNLGAHGFAALVTKGSNSWRLDTHGLLPADLRNRGLDDPDVLPSYHFRDDAMLLYDAIRGYAKAYIKLYYEDEVQILQDTEIQAWAKELVTGKDKGGVGLKGVPGDGQITDSSQLLDILTCIIYTCSVAHAATSFPQYEGYGFPPNYPLFMAGKPPTSKNATVTERELLQCLADKPQTLETMVFSKLFSTKGTNRLGSFELDFIYDPKAKEIVKQFQKTLREVSQEIQSRNRRRVFAYPYLDPEIVPNNISI